MAPTLPGTSNTTASHQVELSHGTNTILISVHSFEIAEHLKTYTLSVSRSGEAPTDSPTTVSVSGLGWARKGSTMPFLLTRTGDTSQSLTVPVDVGETLNKVEPSQEGRREVTFPSGQASVRLDISTLESQGYYFNSLRWGDSRLELALVDDAGYDTNPDASSANAWVWEYQLHIRESPYFDLTSQDGTALNSQGSVDVKTDAEWVTVAPRRVYWQLGTSYVLPPDSRPNVAGHQVDLNYGANLITVSHAPSDREEVLSTRQVTINRPGSPVGDQIPSISIYGPPNGREGERIPFLIARTGDVSELLTVTLDVGETGGDVVPSFLKGRFTVDFQAGFATKRYDLWTDGDDNWEEHSAVSVALVDGDDYDLDSQFQSASLTVADNDVPDMTATLTLDSLEANEGEEITATVTVITDGPKEPREDAGQLRLVLVPGTALYDDFEFSTPAGLGRGVFWVGPIGFEPVVKDGEVIAYQKRKSDTIRIVDDVRAEPDETFDVVLQVDDRFRTVYPRGGELLIDQGGSTHTITIPQFDEVPPAPGPVSFVKAIVSDHGSSGSAFTVTWEDAGDCPNWYRADLFVDDGWLGSTPEKYSLGYSYGGLTEISGTVDNTEVFNENPFGFASYHVQVACIGGFDPISEVEIYIKSWDVPDTPWNGDPFTADFDMRGYKPLPGTYSSEPPLTGLTVTPGTFGPAFNKNGFLYAVLDVPGGSDQITMTATAKAGYTISWNLTNLTPRGIPSEDADPDTDGHQVDLDIGYNSIFVKVEDHPFLNSFTYEVIVKRAASNTTGSPSISGTAQVGETLTVSNSEIADTDGLTNVSYSYQWIRNDGTSDSDISGATSGTYTLVDADEGKTIKVKVSFTDDAGHSETLTSAATAAVAAPPPPPLTASLENVATSHDGENAFTFKVRFSEAPRVGYKKLRDHAFTVSGGTVKNARRLEQGSNSGWRIEIQPNVNDDVTIVLPATGNCADEGAICTEDARKLSSRLELTVNGPESQQQAVQDSPATGQPTIGGTARVGETLTADTSGIADADGLTNAVFGYQWLADGAEISGATGSTYTLVDADMGKAINVTVSFTDDAGNTETLNSAATDAVEARPNSPATGEPTINGTAQVGETLNADTSNIEDADGLYDVAFSYQWLADGADIAGATASTYTLADSDDGKAISITVSFTDDASNAETLTSAATAAVDAKPNTPATGEPTISGTARVGETLAADTSGIADEDGLTSAAFAYQWVADGAEISGATDDTYTLVDAEEGKAISITVSFTDDAGDEETLTSAATGAVEAKPNSPATGQPAISGTALVGETVTVDASGIADDDGLDNVSYSYQWISNDGSADSEIGGATGSTYILASDDVGKTIKVRVSFTDDRGHQEQLTSTATDAVEARPLPPLTASLDNTPSSHDGESAFTFELRFSEEFDLSYKTLRDHAFTVTGGAVRKAQRLEQGSNIGWRITVRPDGNGQVAVVLPETTDCDAQGAICTGDGRKLSHSLELTVGGPGQ